MPKKVYRVVLTDGTELGTAYVSNRFWYWRGRSRFSPKGKEYLGPLYPNASKDHLLSRVYSIYKQRATLTN